MIMNKHRGPCLNTILVIVGSPPVGSLPEAGSGGWFACTESKRAVLHFQPPPGSERGVGGGGSENCGESTNLLEVF
jgi:hypothetical protein